MSGVIGITFGNHLFSGSYPASSVAADLALIKPHINRLRICPRYTNVPAVTNCRLAAVDAKAAGFYVMYGISGGAGTSSLNLASWPTFTAAVMAEAAWAQSQGFDCYIVGNEEELHAQWSISSLTSSGTTATCVTSAAHGFTAANPVTISGAAQANYNGSFTITVLDSTSFTYTMPGTAVSPATLASGSPAIRAQDITIAQMGTNIRALGASVKGVFSGTVTYNALQSTYSDYVANGIAGLDTIGINNYGASGLTPLYISNIAAGKAAWGSAFYLSEFNLDSAYAVTGTDAEIAARIYERHRINQQYGVPGYFFAWRTLDDTFAARLNNGTFRLLWSRIVAERGPMAARSAIPTRSATTGRRATPTRGAL